MRVGKDNLWGYSFKLDSGVSYEQQMALGVMLAYFADCYRYFTDSTFMVDGTRIELINAKEVWGFGMKGLGKDQVPIGIIWGTSDKHLLEAVFRAELDKTLEFWPYKVEPGYTYIIQDSEAFIGSNKRE